MRSNLLKNRDPCDFIDKLFRFELASQLSGGLSDRFQRSTGTCSLQAFAAVSRASRQHVVESPVPQLPHQQDRIRTAADGCCVIR